MEQYHCLMIFMSTKNLKRKLYFYENYIGLKRKLNFSKKGNYIGLKRKLYWAEKEIIFV